MAQSVTLYDLDAGFLDDELLGSQMRCLTGVVGTDWGDTTASWFPGAWLGHEDALALRLNQLIDEMALRGYPTPERVRVTREAVLWPPLEASHLEVQLADIRERAREGKTGRIRLPETDHELWASFKYSLLARNRRAYERLGRSVAERRIPLGQLWLILSNALRVAPTEGGIRNALQHMWGYVSSKATVRPDSESTSRLAAQVRELALSEQVSYLVNSTALGELSSWLRGSE